MLHGVHGFSCLWKVHSPCQCTHSAHAFTSRVRPPAQVACLYYYTISMHQSANDVPFFRSHPHAIAQMHTMETPLIARGMCSARTIGLPIAVGTPGTEGRAGQMGDAGRTLLAMRSIEWCQASLSPT